MNILPQLQEHIKTELSLKTFLNYLIKNKIYDKELYITNLRDSANNNILLVAGAHKLWREIEQLVPFLDKSVLNYKNKNGRTLGQLCMEQPLAWSLANKLWDINPKSFLLKPTEYVPNFHGIKDPVIKDLNTQLCIEHIDKLTYIGVELFKDMVEKKGFECFSGIEQDAVTYRVFYTYLDYKKLVNKDANDKDFYNVVEKIINASRENGLNGRNFIQKLLTNHNGDVMAHFINFYHNNPRIVDKLGFNYLDEKNNSCLHLFVQHCKTKLSPEEKEMLNILLEHCHHYNTINFEKKDIYSLALQNNKREVADILMAFIEKKLMTNNIGKVELKEKKKITKL